MKGQKHAPEFVICKKSEAERYKGDDYDKYLHAKYTVKNVEFDRKRADSKAVTEADRHYFEEAVQEYQENFLGTLEPKTQKEYNRYIEYWLKHFSRKRLSEIIPALIVSHQDKLKKEVIKRKAGGHNDGKVRSATTVNRYIATLSGVMTYCMKKKFWLMYNPCTPVQSLKEPEGVERMLSEEEQKRYIEIVEKDFPKLKLPILLALVSGAR